MGEVWAHSRNEAGVRQTLRDHLLGTAARAEEFGSAFGAGDAAYAVGLFHDAGKVAAAWQARLMALEDGRPAGRVDHKNLGASAVNPIVPGIGPLSILGHHGGVPNSCPGMFGPGLDVDREAFLRIVPEAQSVLDRGRQLPVTWERAAGNDPGVVEFGTRMLHSTLVDADFLDTAGHFTPGMPDPAPAANFGALFDRFEAARHRLLSRRASAPVDRWRTDVYDACLTAAEGATGVYRLPAPTGAGKTLASAGFALRHAAAHGMRRVIVAVPFITITEQNADVYRSMLGPDAVLEHHSWVEPGERARARYGVENWDSPFIVTTTVQLFESLFSNRPGRARKLHRLAGAVIVLDEIQAVPARVLPTVLDGLRLLVTYFGASVLLASATQPVWEMLGPWRDFGVRVHEVLPDPARVYAGMARVQYTWMNQVTLSGVASTAAGNRQCLIVLNTTADARTVAIDLRERFPDLVVRHLSTRMCPAHRRQVLGEVRARLADGDPVTLVATQVIEAGVDVDFPIVYRAVAPAESLVQAAGRANREGRLRRGKVVIFDATDAGAPRSYRTGTALAIQHFRDNPALLDDPSAITGYYRQLYSATNPDGQRFARDLAADRRDLQFETVAGMFRMIDDDTTPVMVPFDEAAEHALDTVTAQAARGRVPTPADLRRLQPFMVSLPRRLLERPDIATSLAAVPQAPGVTVWRGGYDRLTGIDTSGGPTDSIF